MRERKCIAVVLSGGTGERFGNKEPKQYLMIGKKPMIGYCLDTLSQEVDIDYIWVVANEKYYPKLRALITQDKLLGFSRPGENRQLSIFQAFCDMESVVSLDSIIMIHDAVRPFLTHELIQRCLKAMEGHDGVLPVLPMTDTVYRSEDGEHISGLENRSCIFAGQAPEFFLYGKYLEAMKQLTYGDLLQINGSTEPAFLARLDVRMIPGDRKNVKITMPEDIRYFNTGLDQKRGVGE